MAKMANVINSVSDSLSGTLDVGDAPDVLDLPSVRVEVGKEEPSVMSSEISSSHGALTMPDLGDLFDEPEEVGCLIRKVSFHQD